MARSPVVAIGITFRDRDGNKGKATIHCPVAVPIADCWSLAYAVAARMDAISDARLIKVDLIWRYTVDDMAEPSMDANLERKILLLHINADDEINGMIIPSPRVEIWETLGSYAGIRLDMTSTGALAWIDMLSGAELVTRDNHELGDLVAGGLAL